MKKKKKIITNLIEVKNPTKGILNLPKKINDI